MAGLRAKADPKLREDQRSKDDSKVMAGLRAMATHPKPKVGPSARNVPHTHAPRSSQRCLD